MPRKGYTEKQHLRRASDNAEEGEAGDEKRMREQILDPGFWGKKGGGGGEGRLSGHSMLGVSCLRP